MLSKLQQQIQKKGKEKITTEALSMENSCLA
jgi:hypothetical protein